FNPYIQGSVISGDPVEVTLFIKNLETDIAVEDARLTVYDINNSQALRSSDVTFTQPGSVIYSTAVTNTNLFNVSNSGFTLVLDNNISATQGVYTKYTLDSISADQLNMPLNAYLDFNVTINGKKISFTKRKLNATIPLCSEGDYVYQPEKGRFNVIDPNINPTSITTSSKLKYNLFTQTTNRPFPAEIVSFSPSDLDKPSPLQAFIAIELVDLGGMHDTQSACNDPSTALTPKVWMHYRKDDNSTTMQKRFDYAYIQEAINDNLTDLTSPDQFYEHTRKNVGFRVWYPKLVDLNDTLLNPEYLTDNNGNVKVKLDFVALKANYECDDPKVEIASECGNNSGEVKLSTWQNCLECIFGKTAIPTCSRDNFSIRPESFQIQLFDSNQTTSYPNPIALGHTSELSAGYDYRFDINATTHTNNIGAKGYSVQFNDSSKKDHNVSFNWKPLPALDLSGCNDTNASTPNFFFNNGVIKNKLARHSNIGHYQLSMIDSDFTKVDQSPAHHTDVTYWLSGDDCLKNSHIVPASNVDANANNMGCNISSTHTNVDYPSLSTQDYQITFHPYTFDISDLAIVKDMSDTPVLKNTGILNYMSDLSLSTAMGLRFDGKIKPAGADGSSLSNFVDRCYAKDINITIAHNAPDANATVPQFQYRLQEHNSSGAVIFDTNATDFTTQSITIAASEFNKPEKGVFDGLLSLNFERSPSKPKDILQIDIDDFKLSCSDLVQCQSQADLEPDHIPDITKDMNNSLMFAYGRIHAPRYRIEGPNGKIKIY
ncbi:MAG: hypothetical protein OEW60_06850, partial [Thiovulaceae bacterium]|nr:hypothetical protein [Sulfurimonadaceae bacterium]